MRLEQMLVLGPALAALLLVGCRGLAVGPDLRLRGPASLSGRVTALGSGAPVEGATVVFQGAGALQAARTGRDGRYILRVVWERGEEAASGLAPLRATVEARSHGPLTLRVPVSAGPLRRDFELPAAPR